MLSRPTLDRPVPATLESASSARCCPRTDTTLYRGGGLLSRLVVPVSVTRRRP